MARIPTIGDWVMLTRPQSYGGEDGRTFRVSEGAILQVCGRTIDDGPAGLQFELEHPAGGIVYINETDIFGGGYPFCIVDPPEPVVQATKTYNVVGSVNIGYGFDLTVEARNEEEADEKAKAKVEADLTAILPACVDIQEIFIQETVVK